MAKSIRPPAPRLRWHWQNSNTASNPSVSHCPAILQRPTRLSMCAIWNTYRQAHWSRLSGQKPGQQSSWADLMPGIDSEVGRPSQSRDV